MVHTYIGARYVPRFVGTFDPTQQYEALDVVDNGSGTSYIARKTVPPGTSLTDTEYWFVYGASSGAILDLQNRVGTIETVDLPMIDAQLDLSKANMIFLADSYGSRDTSGGKKLLVAVGDALGCTYNQFYAGGIGFTNHGGNGTFLQLLQNSTITIPADEVSHIVVVGGTNDHDETPADILAAITTFINYCKSTYPNAKIIIGFDGSPRFSQARLEEARKACQVYSLAMSRGAQFMWGLENVLHTSSYLESDQIHPNAAGVDALAGAMVGCLKTGQWKVNYLFTPTFTFNTASTAFSAGSLTGTITQRLSGDFGYITPSFGWMELTLPSTGAVPTGRQKVFIPNSKQFVGDTSGFVGFEAQMAILNASNDVLDKGIVIVYFDEDGDLGLIINRNDFEGYSTATKLRITFAGRATVPLLGC